MALAVDTRRRPDSAFFLLVVYCTAAAAEQAALPLLRPHNLTACTDGADARRTELCNEFHRFMELNVSSCHLPDVGCLNASGCLPLYGVPACIATPGLNVTGFNYSVCADFVATLASPLVNVTGCEGLLNQTAAGAGTTTYVSAAADLPEFHECQSAFSSANVRRLDFLERMRPYVSYMVIGLSPTIGPVTGGVSVAVCGVGFVAANEQVNALKCRFSDGYNSAVVPAIFVDRNLLRCRAPDFSRLSVGLPHTMTVQVSMNRGRQWSGSKANFTLYSTRPTIDALGRPIWGYDVSGEQTAWQVESAENDFVWRVPPLYPESGHPGNRGRPSRWDGRSDPFHVRGPDAATTPVATHVGERMPLAEDNLERVALTSRAGVEGSWGDRRSFLRAHYLVPDTYRQAVIAARKAADEQAAQLPPGEI